MTVARNPIPPRDERFTLDPTPWVEGTVLEHYADDAGFFHVTTNRDRVFADGRLRSRQDVGIVGLVPDECELRFKPEDVSIVAVDCQDKENVVR